MKCLSVLFGLVLVSLPGSLLAAPLELFVSPEGRDDWSGRQASPNSSRSDGPFATLPAALNAARIARENNTVPDGVTIWLRGGLYELTEPIKLIPEDSGANPQHPLLIAAYKSEKAVLSGGRRVTGWHPVPGKPSLWQADVPAVREGNWYFRQLFINGERKQRARTPNDGFFRINGPSPQTQPVQFKFNPGEIKKSWADDGDVEVIAYLAWADIRMQIRTVDEEKQLVTLSGNPRPSNKEDRAQYYIENAPDALDQPGEWYLERKTGRLTYWASDVNIRILIKKESFIFPVGFLLRKLGGIPVDRGKKNNMVTKAVELLTQNESMVIVITPEGTRKLSRQWKKGFYVIAIEAKVPIVLAYIDYKTKTGGVGEIFYPTGDYEKDMVYILDFYKGKTARHPELFNLSTPE